MSGTRCVPRPAADHAPRRQRRAARHPATHRIDWNEVIFKGLTLKGSTPEMFETWYKMAAMRRAPRRQPDHHPPLPIAQYRDGFEIMRSGSPEGHPRLGGLSAAAGCRPAAPGRGPRPVTDSPTAGAAASASWTQFQRRLCMPPFDAHLLDHAASTATDCRFQRQQPRAGAPS